MPPSHYCCCCYDQYQPVSDSHRDAFRRCFLQDFEHFVRVPAGNVLSVDLQDLITKAQSNKCSRRVCVYERHKHSLQQQTQQPNHSQWHRDMRHRGATAPLPKTVDCQKFVGKFSHLKILVKKYKMHIKMDAIFRPLLYPTPCSATQIQ